MVIAYQCGSRLGTTVWEWGPPYSVYPGVGGGGYSKKKFGREGKISAYWYVGTATYAKFK